MKYCHSLYCPLLKALIRNVLKGIIRTFKLSYLTQNNLDGKNTFCPIWRKQLNQKQLCVKNYCFELRKQVFGKTSIVPINNKKNQLCPITSPEHASLLYSDVTFQPSSEILCVILKNFRLASLAFSSCSVYSIDHSRARAGSRRPCP